MKISARCDYALRALLELAIIFPELMGHLRGISQRRKIPLKFLEQIMRTLKKGGFIQSKKGPNGGYTLARKPSSIFLGEVIRYIDGPISPSACIDSTVTHSCCGVTNCVLKDIWKKVNHSISEIIDKINFQELMENEKQLNPANMFWI